jgi:hypothetical protein
MPVSRNRCRLGLVTVVIAVCALVAAAADADALPRPRPNDVSPDSVETAVAPSSFQVFNDYATPERTLATRFAVVHYVVTGIDAPPLNDDDTDGVPDYVERVGDAADTAIAYYAQRGFARIRPDEGGPDARADIYISRFTPGVFGASLPHGSAAGGAFAAVANTLDPSAGRSLGSIYSTVAHEVFHLVQFSYFALNVAPDLPLWVSEGSAAAMESRVYPRLDDIVWALQTNVWLARPEQSLADESYGAQLFWSYVDERFPHLLPAYLRRLGARVHSPSGAPELAQTFRRVSGAPLGALFHRFSVSVAQRYGARLAPGDALRPGTTRNARAPALGARYIRIALPRARTRPLTVEVASRGTVFATLTYRVAAILPFEPSGFVRRSGARAGHVVRFTLPARVVANRRVFGVLVVATAARATAGAAVAVRVR